MKKVYELKINRLSDNHISHIAISIKKYGYKWIRSNREMEENDKAFNLFIGKTTYLIFNPINKTLTINNKTLVGTPHEYGDVKTYGYGHAADHFHPSFASLICQLGKDKMKEDIDEKIKKVEDKREELEGKLEINNQKCDGVEKEKFNPYKYVIDAINEEISRNVEEIEKMDKEVDSILDKIDKIQEKNDSLLLAKKEIAELNKNNEAN